MTKNCKNCNKKFESYRRSKQHCSIECFKEYQKKPDVIKEALKKSKETKLKKYGDENYVNSTKAKQTNLEKYGVDNPAKAECVKEKSKQTNLEKYGVEYLQQSEVFKEKTKQTNLEKYGVDNPAKAKCVKEKSKHTCLEKYGVISPALVKEIKEKQQKTLMKNYGVENSFLNKEIQNQIKKIMIEKYGVKYPLQNKDILEKTKQTNIERYGVDNPLKNEKIRNQIKETNLEKYGFEYPSMNENIKEKTKQTNIERYGVEYPQLLEENQLERAIQHKKTHYKKLFITNRLHNLVKPLFSEEEYVSIPHGNNLKFECLKCKNVFDDHLSGGNIPRCLTCFPILQSQIQNSFCDYIKSIIKNPIIENDKTILNGYGLDLFIPSLNLAIEFNGNYWHSEIGGKRYKNYHINKTNKCNEKGIRLIHIFEDEWIYKQEIIKKKLNHILKLDLPQNKIYARKCEIKEIESSISCPFLEKYHIQGNENAPIRLGAYYNDELVGVMTFGLLRLSLGNKGEKKLDEYEMYRFCVGDKNVVGIGGKLLSYFIKKYNPKLIISYADMRWSDHTSFYIKIGFKLISITSPNYWYVSMKSYMNRIHRFNFRKQNLQKLLPKFDPILTEWENMVVNGYDRIWDCGNLKYEWTK